MYSVCQETKYHVPVPLAPTTMRQKDTPFFTGRRRGSIVQIRSHKLLSVSFRDEALESCPVCFPRSGGRAGPRAPRV